MWREGLGESVKLDLRRSFQKMATSAVSHSGALRATHPIESDGLAACPAAEAPIERSGF